MSFKPQIPALYYFGLPKASTSTNPQELHTPKT